MRSCKRERCVIIYTQVMVNIYINKIYSHITCINMNKQIETFILINQQDKWLFTRLANNQSWIFDFIFRKIQSGNYIKNRTTRKLGMNMCLV